jgi:hypothetical protein
MGGVAVAGWSVVDAAGGQCASARQRQVHQEARTPAERITLVAVSAARRAASATGRLRNSGVLDSTQYGPVKPARRTAWISPTTSSSPRRVIGAPPGRAAGNSRVPAGRR